MADGKSSTVTRFLQQSPEDAILHRALTLPARHRGRLRLADATAKERETKYQLVSEEPSGEGGTALVFRVLDTELNVVRALKVLLADLAAHPGEQERWRREQRLLLALERVDAPGVPTIFDVGSVDGMPAIIMQFLDGMTLRNFTEQQHWKQTPSTIPEVQKRLDFVIGVVVRVAETLRHIQNEFAGTEFEGFAHGDLKPSNILLENRREPDADKPIEISRVWLLDFGEASVCSRPESRGITPAYSSPEQLQEWISRHESAATPASDQYQLGVILQELLLAVEQSVPAAHLAKTWSARLRLRRLRTTADRMTSRRPEDRYPNFADVVREMRRADTAPRRVLARAGAVGLLMIPTLIAVPSLLRAPVSTDDTRPVTAALAATAVANEWSRWQSEPLRDGLIDELSRQVQAQYDPWRAAYGAATAEEIKLQLQRRLGLLAGGEYVFRIIDARPSSEFDQSFDTVFVSLEVDKQWIGPLTGGVPSGGSVSFEQSELAFTWQPGQRIELLFTTQGERERKQRQAAKEEQERREQEDRHDEEQRAEYERKLHEYERLRSEYNKARANDAKVLPPVPIRPQMPRPAGPRAPINPEMLRDPWRPWFGKPVFARGAVALAVETRCTDSDGERLIGRFNSDKIDWEVEIRPAR
jgi:serine/threonine protein kinase